MKVLIYFPCIFVVLTAMFVRAIVFAPYQVSLRLYDTFNSNNNADSFTLCSAAIVHPFFILTTAHCLHSHIISQQISRPLSPNSFYVVAGNFTVNSVSMRYVNAIYIHNSYNERTMENDIGLIKLETPFELRNTADLQWIELADNATKLTNCFFSFNNASSKLYPFTSSQSTSIVDNKLCNIHNITSIPGITTTDFCSDYSFSDSFMCKVSENQLKLSNDRGTPLVCNNKLVGLLSVIVPPGNDTNSTNETCSKSLKTTAYYTKVPLYVNWIHSIIGVNLPATSNGQPTSIVPNTPAFHGSTTTPSHTGNGSASIFALSSPLKITFIICFISWTITDYFALN